MPVYNEEATLDEVVSRVLALDLDVEIELIAVNDGSTDRSLELLSSVTDARLRVVDHGTNRGKGAAVRSGIAASTGEIVVVQDADLEYDPAEWDRLLQPVLAGEADVVYGSRFLGDALGMRWQNRAANKLLTWLTRILYGSRLTDMETCYKVMRRPTVAAIELEADQFDLEPEITARLLRRGVRIVELPITYEARTHDEGKKIGWRDGLQAISTLVKWRFRRRA